MDGIDHQSLVLVVLVVYVRTRLVDLNHGSSFFSSLLFFSLPFPSLLSFLYPLSHYLVGTPFTFFYYLLTLLLTLSHSQTLPVDSRPSLTRTYTRILDTVSLTHSFSLTLPQLTSNKATTQRIGGTNTVLFSSPLSSPLYFTHTHTQTTLGTHTLQLMLATKRERKK